jgi:hypothetical protein
MRQVMNPPRIDLVKGQTMNYPEERGRILDDRNVKNWQERSLMRTIDSLHVSEAITLLENLIKLMENKRQWLQNRKR